jgi:hypothetical protein
MTENEALASVRRMYPQAMPNVEAWGLVSVWADKKKVAVLRRISETNKWVVEQTTTPPAPKQEPPAVEKQPETPVTKTEKLVII